MGPPGAVLQQHHPVPDQEGSFCARRLVLHLALVDRVFSKTPRLLIDGRERAISSRKLLHRHSPTAYKASAVDERRSFVTQFAMDTGSFPSVTR